MSNTRSIAIVGVGGQGTVLTSDILIEGLVDLGFDVKKTEQHGLSQQDGSVNCMVKYGDAVYAPIIADGEADVVVAFEKIEALRWLKLLKAGGTLIVNAGEKVYAGEVVGYTPTGEDITVNVCKTKHLTNTRASGSDDALRLVPVSKFSLEESLEFLKPDELLEVTPSSIRIRKRILNHDLRMKATKGGKNIG